MNIKYVTHLLKLVDIILELFKNKQSAGEENNTRSSRKTDMIVQIVQ